MVEVEYLNSDQWLMIPSGLGINPVTPAIVRVNPRPELITRYWQITRMPYDRMKELMQQNTSAATVCAEIARFDSTPGTTLFADWGIGPAVGEADPKSVVDNVYMFVSKNAEMNFDVRDMGILNADNMSVTDVAWRNLNDVDMDRVSLKINEYSMQQLAALNLVPCAGSKLAAWTRAYGVGCGIMPHPTSRMMKEYCWTDSFAKQENVRACLAWEKEMCSGKPTNMICLNIIGLFGLFHLNKDHTFCNNDPIMNRICTSWLNTLDSITTKTMQNEILKQKEALCRIAAHPFGLAQTYWLAQVLGRTNMLASKLALTIDASPPPVQRFLVFEATFSDWGKLATGKEVNYFYKERIELILEGVDLVRKCPPAYSELYKLYGLDEKNDLRKEITEALWTMMPLVFGYARSKHGDKGIIHGLKMEYGEVIINWWTNKWDMDNVEKAYPTSTSSSADGYLG
ncbi:hypothetical protein MtrunA17_Chr3g0093781 [Medicago truncatula]|uniref:Uncharacterized protein n=1 Tax=Medicago truncatula TaxID=3880 RepID=A0A396IRU5_MEDTR|nr:hypothetical protein MtrunA17_Chr3g0093781 [Medicago truncatula]